MSAYLASKEDRIRSQLVKRMGQQQQLKAEEEEKEEEERIKEEEEELNGTGAKPAKIFKQDVGKN